MNNNSQNFILVFFDLLDSSCTAINQRIDGLKVRRVREDLQNNLLTVKLSFASVSQMILDVTCEFIVLFSFFVFLQELFENLLSWFLEDTVKGIESTSMSHTHLNILDSHFGSSLNQLPQSCRARVQTFDTKTFKIAKLGSQEINKSLILGKSMQSR